MIMIGHALALFATMSVVFSHGRIPDGYNCVWTYDSWCANSIGQIPLTKCKCNCGGSFLCCDANILDDYDYPQWHGRPPFCQASCEKSCGSSHPALCWWQSRCGQSGAECLTGSKYLCGYPKRRIGYPFMKTVSSSLQRY